MIKDGIGFYVQIEDTKYSQPFETLKQAREEAKTLSKSKLKIFHGKLIKNGDNIDTSELFLVPRIGGYNV